MKVSNYLVPFFFFGFIGLQGCTTYPPSTGYVQKDGTGYGFEILEKKEVNVSVYRGNNWTTGSAAFVYSIFAAYDFCDSKGKTSDIYKTEEVSEKATYGHVSSYSLPITNANGTTTYLNQVSTRPVTIKFPIFVTPFVCRKKFLDLEGISEMESVSRELVHPMTKDFKGGLLVKDFDSKKNQNPLFKSGDVLLSVNAKRIETLGEYYDALEASSSNNVQISFLNSGKIKTKRARVLDYTDRVIATRALMLKEFCPHAPRQENENALEVKRAVAYPKICDLIPKSQPPVP